MSNKIRKPRSKVEETIGKKFQRICIANYIFRRQIVQTARAIRLRKLRIKYIWFVSILIMPVIKIKLSHMSE